MKETYDFIVSASGRVNLIGEHVDYCGGKVFPAALSLKNYVSVRANDSDKIRLCWTDLLDEVVLDIARLDSYKNVKHANYIAGSLYEWQQAGGRIVGADMLFDCKVPFGSGLSSSAAIEVSAIAAMCAVTGTPLDKPKIALAAQRAERNYAGVNCGIMDQYASACGQAGHAMLLDCATLACEQVPLDFGDYALVIINCNKPHNLAESKYNERRAETEEALRLLQTVLDVKNLAEVGVSRFEEVGKKVLSGKVYDRAKHVVYECDRVGKAVAAMQRGDVETFGKLLNASHNSLRDLYEVTGKELDALQEAALASPYCIGSRMTGGGFGGCTISLVKNERKEEFIEDLTARYTKEIGYPPSAYLADVSDGITINKLR